MIARRVVVFLLGLLVFAMSAAFSSEAACKAAVREEEAREKPLRETRSPLRGTWRCLPAPVDPRAPKAR